MKIIGFFAVFVWFIYLVTLEKFAIGQDLPPIENDSILNKDWSYCFEFTWFGPDYDNISRYNDTCTEYLDNSRTDTIPCSPPIVISYNGTPPDLDWLWENKKVNILCRRSINKVCAKYTYKYNGIIQNATYMCTKVQVVDEGAITDGCFTQVIDGYERELCICESNPGIYKPCNSATSLSIITTSIWTFIAFTIMLNLYNF